MMRDEFRMMHMALLGVLENPALLGAPYANGLPVMPPGSPNGDGWRSYDSVAPMTALPAQTPIVLLPPTSPAVRYCDLFELMGLHEPLFLADDVEEVLRRGGDLDETAIGRATWLMVTDRFRDWLQYADRRSDLVLVNGHMGDIATGKVSPLSVFGASLVKVRKAPQFVVLHHFCGLHAHRGDPLCGPSGMLRSLIAQLLLHGHQRSGGAAGFPAMNAMFVQDLAQYKLYALCELFRALVRQLDSASTVYCLVDNVCEFETTLGDWQDQLVEIIGLFQDMVRDAEMEALFKVLLTATHRSTAVGRHIHLDDQIWLSAGNVYSHSMRLLSFEQDLERVAAPNTG
jgi:hypothetical protein